MARSRDRYDRLGLIGVETMVGVRVRVGCFLVTGGLKRVLYARVGVRYSMCWNLTLMMYTSACTQAQAQAFY